MTNEELYLKALTTLYNIHGRGRFRLECELIGNLYVARFWDTNPGTIMSATMPDFIRYYKDENKVQAIIKALCSNEAERYAHYPEFKR